MPIGCSIHRFSSRLTDTFTCWQAIRRSIHVQDVKSFINLQVAVVRASKQWTVYYGERALFGRHSVICFRAVLIATSQICILRHCWGEFMLRNPTVGCLGSLCRRQSTEIVRTGAEWMGIDSHREVSYSRQNDRVWRQSCRLWTLLLALSLIGCIVLQLLRAINCRQLIANGSGCRRGVTSCLSFMKYSADI